MNTAKERMLRSAPADQPIASGRTVDPVRCFKSFLLHRIFQRSGTRILGRCSKDTLGLGRHDFARNESAGSAIEFALVVPIMLVILMSMAELAHALDNWRKVSLVTRAISDLTAQGDTQNPVRTSVMNDILASASPILRPFDGSAAKIVVSALGVDQNNPALPPQVCSSVASRNAPARGRGIAGDLTVPAGMGLPGMRYILVEVTMPYTPILGGAIIDLFGTKGGQVMLRASMPWPVRKGETFAPSTYPEIVLPNGVRC